MEQKLIDYKTAKEYLLAVFTYIHHQNIKLTKLKEMFNFDEDSIDQQIIKDDTEYIDQQANQQVLITKDRSFAKKLLREMFEKETQKKEIEKS